MILGDREQHMVDYIGVSDIQRLVQAVGVGAFIERLAAEIEVDTGAGTISRNPRGWRAIPRSA